MNYTLLLFYRGSIRDLLLLLFAENLLISFCAVIMGVLLLKTLGKPFQIPGKRERKFFFITILLNTFITYLGFLFWETRHITISLNIDLSIITDFIFVIVAMDFITWCLHFLLHWKPLFEKIHYLTHVNKNLTPANLFVIHPIETLMFGFAWIAFLMYFTLNIYAIILFLVFNVILGVVANLGISIPAPKNSIAKFLVSPAFRIEHHQSGHSNFGYYTKLWDSLFKTLSASFTNFAKNTL